MVLSRYVPNEQVKQPGLYGSVDPSIHPSVPGGVPSHDEELFLPLFKVQFGYSGLSNFTSRRRLDRILSGPMRMLSNLPGGINSIEARRLPGI